jgi:hypothetical protein
MPKVPCQVLGVAHATVAGDDNRMSTMSRRPTLLPLSFRMTLSQQAALHCCPSAGAKPTRPAEEGQATYVGEQRTALALRCIPTHADLNHLVKAEARMVRAKKFACNLT